MYQKPHFPSTRASSNAPTSFPNGELNLLSESLLLSSFLEALLLFSRFLHSTRYLSFVSLPKRKPVIKYAHTCTSIVCDHYMNYTLIELPMHASDIARDYRCWSKNLSRYYYLILRSKVVMLSKKPLPNNWTNANMLCQAVSHAEII